MTLEQYLAILVKRRKLVVICFLFVGVGALIGSKLMKPLYQSSALVQIVIRSSNSGQLDYNSLAASDELVQTEATLAVSNRVLQKVVPHYPGLTVSQLTGEVSASPRTNTQLFEIDVVDPSPARAAAIANAIAMALIQQQSQVAQQDFLQLVQPAQPAATPVRPNILLYTGGGLLVGLLLGLLLAPLYERLDARVRTPEGISQLLEWPVLATIWHVNSSSPENMVNPAGHNVNVESYRILRTNIGFSSIDTPLHSLIVTSALPGEGKSVIAANLAIFMARAGKNTLLIDANLRRPIQHRLFGLSNDTLGLSNAILAFSVTGPSMPTTPSIQPFDVNSSALQPQGASTTTNGSLEPFVHSIGIPNLWVMPSGSLPPNPSELLESKAMQRFLTVIANSEFEVVIFDTPSLLGLSDTSSLISKVVDVLVVVDTTRATKEKLKQMKVVLSQTRVRVIGCVANKLQHQHNDSTYYYHTEVQINGEESTGNGHRSPVPVTPAPSESSLDRNNTTVTREK